MSLLRLQVSTQTSWTSEPQDQGVLMISCTLWTGACEASTQVSYFAHERPTTADASIAAVSLRDHQPKGFYGYQSLVNHSEKDDALRDLTGVTAMVFLTLLNLLSKVNRNSLKGVTAI